MNNSESAILIKNEKKEDFEKLIIFNSSDHNLLYNYKKHCCHFGGPFIYFTLYIC